MSRSPWWTALLLGVACAGRGPSPASPTQAAPGCTSSARATRASVAAGETRAVAGIAVTFFGHGHDDFVDGGFDDWVSLRLRLADRVEERMLGRADGGRAWRALGRCWTLVEANSERVVLDVVPAPGPDLTGAR